MALSDSRHLQVALMPLLQPCQWPCQELDPRASTHGFARVSVIVSQVMVEIGDLVPNLVPLLVEVV